MTRPLIQIMQEAWATAITEGRNPRRWEVNEAAKSRLKHEQQLHTVDFPDPENDAFMAPIFGIPVLKIWDKTDDPRFNLIVDELEDPAPFHFDTRVKPLDVPPVLEMIAGTPTIDECYFGQMILRDREPDPTTPTEISMIIDELRRRDVQAPDIDAAERERRAKAWDPNPPCPKCGSFDHFEC